MVKAKARGERKQAQAEVAKSIGALAEEIQAAVGTGRAVMLYLADGKLTVKSKRGKVVHAEVPVESEDDAVRLATAIHANGGRRVVLKRDTGKAREPIAVMAKVKREKSA
jgi:hypothetical protein